MYVVSTPIGNLRDLTLRALDVLGGVERILAEDTRRTRKLLSHYDLHVPLESHHEHNEERRAPILVEKLALGASMAIVSDAGTPAISDPGWRLVRAAIDAGVDVVPVPGASAPLAALVASGLPADTFTFVGYPPRKTSEKRRFLTALRDLPGTLLLLESPRRLRSTLVSAIEVLGENRPAAIARELTKAHEELRRGSLSELLAALPVEPLRGEITLCVAAGNPPGDPEEVMDPAQLRRRYQELLESGTARAAALRQLVRESGRRRRDVYEAVVLGGRQPVSTDEEDPR